MPDAKQAPGCSEAGILGPVAGLVGTLQALETIKIILGQPRTLTGRLLLIEAVGSDFMEIRTIARPDCSCCGASSSAAD
jgi:adenylyltransferase/sulfurtransferase